MTMTLPDTPQLWEDEDGPRVRRNDPITSHLAADSNTTRRWIEDSIVGLFLEFGPMTDAQLTERYFAAKGMPDAHVDSVRKRRSDLTNKGLVVATDLPGVTPSNRKAIVWKSVWSV